MNLVPQFSRWKDNSTGKLIIKVGTWWRGFEPAEYEMLDVEKEESFRLSISNFEKHVEAGRLERVT